MAIKKLFEFSATRADVFVLGDDLVRIHRDGTLTYGEGYTPDEAADCFWKAMCRRAPGVFEEMQSALARADAAVKELIRLIQRENSDAEVRDLIETRQLIDSALSKSKGG